MVTNAMVDMSVDGGPLKPEGASTGTDLQKTPSETLVSAPLTLTFEARGG